MTEEELNSIGYELINANDLVSQALEVAQAQFKRVFGNKELCYDIRHVIQSLNDAMYSIALTESDIRAQVYDLHLHNQEIINGFTAERKLDKAIKDLSNLQEDS